jgi:hypothetical protein
VKVAPDPALIAGAALRLGERVQAGDPVPPAVVEELARRFGNAAASFVTDYRRQREAIRP